MYTIYPISKDTYVIKSCDRKPLEGLPGPKTNSYWITISKKRLHELIKQYFSSLDFVAPLNREHNQ